MQYSFPVPFEVNINGTGKEYKHMKNKKKQDSPMQVQHWLVRINPNTGKLYTEEEAILHIKSFRKSNIEYWLRIGYSKEDAEQLRKDY